MARSGPRRRTAEGQALAVLAAIRDLARHLEQRRNELRALDRADGSASRASTQARDSLMVDVERLSNLIALAESAPGNTLSPETRRHVSDSLNGLRERATAVGVEAAVRRIRALRSEVEAMRAGGAHPLGRSMDLREAFIHSLTCLEKLSRSLEPDQERDLVAAAAAINSLAAEDRVSPWLTPLAPDTRNLLAEIDLTLFRLNAAIDRAGGVPNPHGEHEVVAEPAAPQRPRMLVRPVSLPERG